MTHIDGDDLALIALGELDLTEAERRHLAECAECDLELISLRHTVEVGRSARSVELEEPSGRVWGRIHAELGLTDAVAAPPRAADYATLSAPVIAPAPMLPPAPAIAAVPDPTVAPRKDGPVGDSSVGDSPVVVPVAAGPAAAGHRAGSRPRSRRGRRFWFPVTVAAGLAGLPRPSSPRRGWTRSPAGTRRASPRSRRPPTVTGKWWSTSPG